MHHYVSVAVYEAADPPVHSLRNNPYVWTLGSKLIADVHSAIVIFSPGAAEVRRKPSGFQGSPTKPDGKMTPPFGFIREVQPDHKQQLE